jgi:hypothetical protein
VGIEVAIQSVLDEALTPLLLPLLYTLSAVDPGFFAMTFACVLIRRKFHIFNCGYTRELHWLLYCRRPFRHRYSLMAGTTEPQRRLKSGRCEKIRTCLRHEW